jgi:hypothetical protein
MGAARDDSSRYSLMRLRTVDGDHGHARRALANAVATQAWAIYQRTCFLPCALSSALTCEKCLHPENGRRGFAHAEG